MIVFILATFNGKHKSNTQQTIELAKRAREIYFDIADSEGIKFDLLKKGILHFYNDEKEFSSAADKASWLDQEGMEWEALSLDEIEIGLSPFINCSISSACFEISEIVPMAPVEFLNASLISSLLIVVDNHSTGLL